MSGVIKQYATLRKKTGYGTSSISTVSILINKAVLIAALWVFFFLPGYAQLVQSNRVEIPFGHDDIPFEVISADQDGLYLLRRVASLDGEKLHLVKFDTAFNEIWSGFLPVDRRFELMGKRNDKDFLFLLFRNREILKKDLEMVMINNKNGNFSKFIIKNYIPFVPTDFQVTQFGAIIGGYFNTVPVVIYYSLQSQTTKLLPGLLNESGELTQIKTDSAGNFDVLISAKNILNQKTIWIKSYDARGDLLYQIPLEPEGNKHLFFARSLKTNGDVQLVAGTYGNRNSEYSRGIFIASIHPNGLQQLRYYSYADLENFFKYMKAKREQRVKARIRERKIRGKKVRLNYRFIVHEIVPYQNQFILLGEAFYPRYITIDRTYQGGFFTSLSASQGLMIRNGRIFDGFRYTHAVVMGFDKNGGLIWDNSFEINDVKTFSLEQFVKLETHPEKIALFYLYENQIRSKIIQGNKVLEGKTLLPVKTNSPMDVAKNERSPISKLDYWYGRYFYAFGIQEISNAKTGYRRVFYINKINYQAAGDD
jgi:hypothetical protein